ncbi:hypothetical protein [Rhodovulum sulfidophilum]|uniref:hypothetical protein n=1 Tax=Rhodovulum sulfidophilum TaxID=35806 RepID=UPI00138A64D5|nr:hypothetical protein [Rhodovulum sulfidophilum]NDK36886.1 hypothetical protein [Rhodovulum sulfidophilum]
MYEYERSYRTGRGVCTLMELSGWLLVFVGFIAVIAGYSSGGPLGFASRNFMGQEPPFLIKLAYTIPGLLTMAAGVYSMMQTQQVKAALDTAEMTREMLWLTRDSVRMAIGQSVDRDANLSKNRHKSEPPGSSFVSKPGDLVLVYMYREVRVHPEGFSVEGNVFPDVDRAKEWIRQRSEADQETQT